MRNAVLTLEVSAVRAFYSTCPRQKNRSCHRFGVNSIGILRRITLATPEAVSSGLRLSEQVCHDPMSNSQPRMPAPAAESPISYLRQMLPREYVGVSPFLILSLSQCCVPLQTP